MRGTIGENKQLIRYSMNDLWMGIQTEIIALLTDFLTDSKTSQAAITNEFANKGTKIEHKMVSIDLMKVIFFC